MTQQISSLDTAALVKKMTAEIQKGRIGDHSRKLASEPELMARYDVTRYTLRQALSQLASMGYTYQAHGIGTFIRPRRNSHTITMQNKVNLAEELSRQAHRLETKKAHQRTISLREAEFLPIGCELPADTRLIEVKRFRTLDGAPYLLECSYYLADVVGMIPENALYGSLFDFLGSQAAIKPGFLDEIISADTLSEHEANFFHLSQGAPALVVRDDSYLNSGQLFAFSKLKYNCENTQLFMFKKLS
ncbi:GntR family transcriptional regulator [Oenococcus kitaharae]|uniref:Transcriptional regulator n=1 Tax=Oenococcus kitaharae DSM 17330 TaxID=1045004 RepID=G9WIJ6_9LACO|nr:GntR family transcriptional regulator [Oenococcus kitaharae]EHN58135.1 Transcriptional regulator [Oenococcus kitaharae DSM 17330]OEY81657.1 GntR family transcriptional regulator [Oenococcus kitaharae]OEY83142.1 GntR family transcriptional regulator [Oenococcus kitaharae]OEY84312.1 GntR family transcriptional regulator [Oenococcus kitaharae]